MNRECRRVKVFRNTSDYEMFLEVLKEAVALWGINVSSYCLMPTHYHILIQTPQANLSRAMRHINSVYTQRFNRKHKGELLAFQTGLLTGDPFFSALPFIKVFSVRLYL